jgi:hypothetical protein
VRGDRARWSRPRCSPGGGRGGRARSPARPVALSSTNFCPWACPGRRPDAVVSLAPWNRILVDTPPNTICGYSSWCPSVSVLDSIPVTMSYASRGLQLQVVLFRSRGCECIISDTFAARYGIARILFSRRRRWLFFAVEEGGCHDSPHLPVVYQQDFFLVHTETGKRCKLFGHQKISNTCKLKYTVVLRH